MCLVVGCSYVVRTPLNARNPKKCFQSKLILNGRKWAFLRKGAPPPALLFPVGRQRGLRKYKEILILSEAALAVDWKWGYAEGMKPAA